MSEANKKAGPTVRIGSGAGYSGDRIDPAVEQASKGNLSYLVFECLAERTIALAQKARLEDPEAGYDPLLEERMEAVLPISAAKGIRIVSNMGAANPRAAARKTCDLARKLGLKGLRVAAVTGDDVLEWVKSGGAGGDALPAPDRIVSANAYLGASPVVEALEGRAEVILTGRVADPALFLGPLVHEFGWRMDDWERLGRGTVVGHLLECAGQVTGGYFADPGVKDVPNLARLGFPLAEVSADGSAILTKVEGSGGCISRATCTEQLLYEILDPSAYFTPDVVADFSRVMLEEVGPNRIHVMGGSGRARPEKLKVSVGYRDGFIGEGQISYAGPGALARARLAAEILRERLQGQDLTELRIDFIGLNAILGEGFAQSGAEPMEIRLRAAGRADTARAADRVRREVEALYTNGPYGGGGVTGSTREVIAMTSTLIPRECATHAIHYEEV
jgi:Acyclic terpene utilisation family protein AtuA